MRFIAKVKNAADPDFAAGPLVPLMVELPVLLFDLVFLACIYAALVKTMDYDYGTRARRSNWKSSGGWRRC